MSETIYQQILMEHYRHSPHRGELADATHQCSNENPSCGDRLSISLKIVDNKIVDMKFIGSGCIISQASASILADHLIGKSVDILQTMTGADLIALLNISLGPNRTRCATLPLLVLEGLKRS